MAREEALFTGVPAWLLVDYLVQLGGANGRDGSITGEGWTAQVTAIPRAQGSLALGQVTVTIAGPRAAEAMADLRVKARRGGG